ncbi:MAG: prepilin-type N-terminal cleavage/methylation domain-containing protein, partial [Thiotrichales bacterium]
MMKQQKGFTLVEMAIVLVIIGLLLGGVLKGQELIDNSKIKSIASDTSMMQAAINGYQDRFRAIPGDENVILNWETQSEINNLGFIIEKSTIKEHHFVEITSYLNSNSLKGQGNSSVSKFYSYTDRNVINGFT